MKYLNEKLVEIAKLILVECPNNFCDNKTISKAINNYLISQKTIIYLYNGVNDKNYFSEKILR